MTGNQEKQPKINLAVKAAEDDLLGTGRTILAEAGRWPCRIWKPRLAASVAICIHLYAGWKRWQTKKLYGKFFTECGMEYIRLSLRGQGKSFLKSVI